MVDTLTRYDWKHPLGLISCAWSLRAYQSFYGREDLTVERVQRKGGKTSPQQLLPTSQVEKEVGSTVEESLASHTFIEANYLGSSTPPRSSKAHSGPFFIMASSHSSSSASTTNGFSSLLGVVLQGQQQAAAAAQAENVASSSTTTPLSSSQATLAVDTTSAPDQASSSPLTSDPAYDPSLTSPLSTLTSSQLAGTREVSLVEHGRAQAGVVFVPPLRDQRKQWLCEVLRKEGVGSVLEVGCGEGES